MWMGDDEDESGVEAFGEKEDLMKDLKFDVDVLTQRVSVPSSLSSQFVNIISRRRR